MVCRGNGHILVLNHLERHSGTAACQQGHYWKYTPPSRVHDLLTVTQLTNMKTLHTKYGCSHALLSTTTCRQEGSDHIPQHSVNRNKRLKMRNWLHGKATLPEYHLNKRLGGDLGADLDAGYR